MEPKDMLFDDIDETNEQFVENVNYNNLGIVGYLINFGIPLLLLLLIIGMGGYVSGMAPLLYMTVVFLLGAALYILGIIFLIGLIADKNKKYKNKKIKTSFFHNFGITIYFFPIIMILLNSLITSLPFFR